MQKETIKEFEKKLENQKKKFEDVSIEERENHRKYVEEMKELYVVSENIVISEMYDIYYVDSVLCSCYLYGVENHWNRLIVYT